jgi:putative aminopeptidase FrvX
MQRLLDILQNLIRIPSVTGYEHSFFISIKRELEQRGITTKYYDGLLVATGSKPVSGYISAHSDRHGLVCTGENEFQYAAYVLKNRADLEGNSVSEQTYQDLVDRFCKQQVFSYDARNGLYEAMGFIKDAYLCPRRSNMIFDIEGLQEVSANTPVAFNDTLKKDGKYLSAQLDNVISVAVIIYLYEIGFEGTAFFSASEEAGKSWRYLLEWFKRYDVTTRSLLVLDTSSFGSKEDLEQIDIVLRHKDANSAFNDQFTSQLEEISNALSLKHIYKDDYILKRNPKKTIGSTELGRLIKGSGEAISGTTLQIPTINYHTTSETTTVDALKSVIAVLCSLYTLDNRL